MTPFKVTIMAAENGFVTHTEDYDTYVFETLDGMLGYLTELYADDEGTEQPKDETNLTQPLASDTELREEEFVSRVKIRPAELDEEDLQWAQEEAAKIEPIDATDEVTPEEAMAVGKSTDTVEELVNQIFHSEGLIVGDVTYTADANVVVRKVGDQAELFQYNLASERENLWQKYAVDLQYADGSTQTPDPATVLDGKGIGEDDFDKSEVDADGMIKAEPPIQSYTSG